MSLGDRNNVEGRPGWRFGLGVTHDDGKVDYTLHHNHSVMSPRRVKFTWDAQSGQTRLEAAHAAIDKATIIEVERSAATLAKLRAALKPHIPVGAQVTLTDADDDYPVPRGVVVEPTEIDLATGRERHGTDIEVCVLVEWPTQRNWEYPEDLKELNHG
jgi:hypothetical protein